MARILLLEDDDLIRDAVAEYLTLADHEVVALADGSEAIAACEREPFDMCVLDIMVPGSSGLAVAKHIRARSDTPVLFLTARSDEASRITGFEIGADDYVTKPFSPRELVLRVQAILRRGSGAATAAAGSASPECSYVCGDRRLVLDRERHQVLENGRPVDLTSTEWKVLEALVEHAGRVLSRDAILAAALGYDTGVETRTADTHLKNLRRKLGDPGWIATVRGFGYRFEGVVST